MNVFEQVADWIVNDCDNPIEEVEHLLKKLYWGEGKIFNEYNDVIEITEKKYGECTGVYEIKEGN